MKKNIILSTAAILAGCLFISSCDIGDDFIAPKDTWVYKESTKSDNSFTYTWGEGANEKSVNFDLYVNYATKDSTLTFDQTSAEVKSGVNVILVPTSGTEPEVLKELVDATGIEVALFYSFGEKAEAAADSTESEKKKISLSGIWTLIYKFNRFEKVPTPTMNKLTSDYTLITEVKETLNWKRVLYNMLGDKLFSEN
ncbi:MAG: hypothetical protein MR408_08680 [Spirochaetia bacterium]|nr:hypothetical protein [Spirochaetia bacterium]